MKTSLICLAIALGLRLVASQTVQLWTDRSNGPFNIWDNKDDHPRNVYFIGGVKNEKWLIVMRFDTKGTDQHGFDPSFTYCVSRYKPVVKKLPNGMWQVSFTSEIAENLP